MTQYQGLTAEMYQAIVAIVDDRMEAARVTRRDYDRLVEAQERVEGHMERVEAALERLAEAQARTEDRVGGVEDRVGRLEEGQASMQAAIERLAEAQARTEERAGRVEERVGRLEEGQVALQRGQTAMQAAIERLAEAQARTDATVGGLADVIGYGLEDVARLLLPPYLHKHWDIQLEGPAGEELQRRFLPIEGQPPIEINLYGEGRRDGQRVVVLGEAKSRIGGSAVKDFVDVLERAEPLVEGEVWRVMFGYYIHPSAQPVAEEHRILLVASYQR